MNARRNPNPDSPVERILDEIESGTPLESLPGTIGIKPREIVLALATAALGDAQSLGPTLVQATPARPGLARALSQTALGKLFPSNSRPVLLTLSAGLLQVHDFWDASHAAAQEADDLGEARFSAYWHGIAHRREPDPSNAAYWFRRVGRHPLFPDLAAAARPLLAGAGDSRWESKLIGRGGWDATAMIDLCAGAGPGTSDERLARRLQRLEMLMLSQAGIAALGPEAGD